MTDGQVRDGFSETYNGFWNQYKIRQPNESSPEWERMNTRASVLKKKYPFLEEAVNRMMSEITERARKRGNKPDDFHMPPT